MIALLRCANGSEGSSLALQGSSDVNPSRPGSAQHNADQPPWSMAESTASAGQHDEWLPQDQGREHQEASGPQHFLNFSFKNLELLGKNNQEMMNSFDAVREELGGDDAHGEN